MSKIGRTGLLAVAAKLIPALLAVTHLLAVLWKQSSVTSAFGRSSASAFLPEAIGHSRSAFAAPAGTVSNGNTHHTVGDRPTIVCQLSGEMGNNLGKYAHCYAMALYLERRLGLAKARIVLRHQHLAKWVNARRDLQQCFPHFRHLDFEEGNTPDFDAKAKLLEEMMGPRLESMNGTSTKVVVGIGAGSLLTNVLTDINSPDVEVVKGTLRVFTEKLKDRSQPQNNAPVDPGLPLPFLYSNYMVGLDAYLDEFLDDFRRMFTFDEEACCKLRADPDETVFHLRNFLIELSKKLGTQKGFAEVGPRQAAQDLMGHLRPGDKVAVLSRYSAAYDSTVRPYVAALEQRGLRVRVVSNQTGVQDFCFLRSAQKELVGIALSTYFAWAAVLSEVQSALVYSLDTPERRARGVPISFAHHFSRSPHLKSKFRFRVLVPNETLWDDAPSSVRGQ